MPDWSSMLEGSPPRGLIFDLKRMAVDDGPGIRTTVFLKGCPLHCLWCASPESIGKRPQLVFHEKKCIHCGRCVTVCPTAAQEMDAQGRRVRWERCNACGGCAEVCPSLALRLIGKWMTAEEVFRKIEEDKVFYDNSGGGVTISGGEPTLQVNFLRELLEKCRQAGICTALDTSGHVEWAHLERIVDLVDLFLYDLKHLDAERHARLTGVSNLLILENFQRLRQRRKTVIVRFPLIPGGNDSTDNILAMIEYLKRGSEKLEILPFNLAAGSKYELLGRRFPLADTASQSETELARIEAVFQEAGIAVSLRH